MRAFAAAALMLLIGGCIPGPQAPAVPTPARAARLVIGTYATNRSTATLQAIDPDTLADQPGFEALVVPPCSTDLVVQPTGELAVAGTAPPGRGPRCNSPGTLSLHVLDLKNWTWPRTIALPGASDDAPLHLDGYGRTPIAWSPDGASLYALTADASEQRRLWLVDASGNGQFVSVQLDFVPARLDVAPNGSAVFVLGGRTEGNSRQGAAISGSAFLAIYDPKTLVERIRVPLSGLSLGVAGQPQGTLIPGVAVAPDGSRYYVAHADRPVLDVVDTRAPRLERLERSVSLRDAPSQVATRSAWLGVSPDGAHVYAWHHAETPADDVGMQIIDTHSWQVKTLDPIAQRVAPSLNGRWLFELDPAAWSRAGAAPPQTRGPRDMSGTRLSVVDPTTFGEVATLIRDQFDAGVGQYGADRLYVTEFQIGQNGDQNRRGGRATVVAYDTTSWREIARRQLDAPGALVTTTPLW